MLHIILFLPLVVYSLYLFRRIVSDNIYIYTYIQQPLQQQLDQALEEHKHLWQQLVKLFAY